jgi:hypothetical protein
VRAEAARNPEQTHPEANRSRSSSPPVEAEAAPEHRPAAAEADPLAGVDLAALSDDELFDLFGDLSARDDAPEAALAALDTEMARREEAVEPPPPEPNPLDGVDLDALSDDELYRWWNAYPNRAEVVAAIRTELDRRDAVAATASAAPLLADDDVELTAEQRRIEELIAAGWDYLDAYAEVYGADPADLARQERTAAVDADRRAGETREQAVRRAYDEWVHVQLVAAEQATRGYLLTREGQAAGIDPVSLFSGPAARARKWASEELKRWWADGNPRLTFTEFRAQLLDRDTDQRAAERIRGQGNGRDFGL